MKYQILSGGFPCGQHLIPAGTIIDTTATDQWSMLAKGLPPPLTAMPLDWGTWQTMKELYPGLTHLIVTPAGAER
jgi:hypothetical protein